MKVGFTGTRKGMTHKQKALMRAYAKHFSITDFHHGDCIGADADAHQIVSRYAPGVAIHVHPPRNPVSRAWCQGNYTYEEKDYLDRDRDIVDAVELLFATPKEYFEKRRSGTWFTVRYARKKSSSIIVIFPDGSVSKELRSFNRE